jgi:hypothetical protein
LAVGSTGSLSDRCAHFEHTLCLAEAGHFFKSLGAQLLIAAESGDPFRLAQSGRVDPTSGLKKHEWRNLTSSLDQIGNRLLDLRRVLELLRDQGYRDWLVVEQDTTPLDPTTVARDEIELSWKHF